MNFLDPLLYKAVGWLTDDKLYADASEGGIDVQRLAICCDITTNLTSVYSPKHLGLGVHLYNDHGSRKLIEDMYRAGYTISYPEIRKFLTSAATYIMTNQEITPSGGIVPSELIHKDQGGKQVIGAGDNWDHLERTVDGRNTTHAMTSIMVSPSMSPGPLPRLPTCILDTKSIPG